MSGYSEMAADQRRRDFLERWAKPETLPEMTPDTFRFNIARARAAEARVKELEEPLRGLLSALRKL